MPATWSIPARRTFDMLENWLPSSVNGSPNHTAKRRRDLSQALPELAEAMGKRFTALAWRFIAEVPYPRRGGAASDALNFANWLMHSAKLSQKHAILAMAICTQHRWAPSAARSRTSRQLVWRGRVIKVL